MWTYHQSSGILSSADGQTVRTGYAGGNCGRNPEGINNPEMEDVHNIGPLPTGFYTIGGAIDHTHLGPCAMPLIPWPENEMFQRGGFYIHADTPTPRMGSEGCIVMPADVRQMLAESKDRELVVIL